CHRPRRHLHPCPTRRSSDLVQANSFNKSAISTVLVVVITSNLALAQAPGNIRISKSDSGLSKASVVNVSQVLTIDRQILTERVRSEEHTSELQSRENLVCRL